MPDVKLRSYTDLGNGELGCQSRSFKAIAKFRQGDLGTKKC